MPIYNLNEITEEFVTPKHSTAFGRLITGDNVEVGMLRFKAGQGARPHSHPHEQIVIVLSGKMRMTIGGEAAELQKGQAAHIPPNVLHSTDVIEDTEIVSCKSIVNGVGHRI
jgi:quercetin dioxygenase-like cupin family protein